MDLNDIVDIRLLSVERKGEMIEVQRELLFADGSTMNGKHVFPQDTLEWRAAEYEIDPADTDTLLDMVLWEPLLDEDDEPDLDVHSAPTIRAARERHLERIAKRKGKAPKLRRLGADPVREAVKGMCVMNPEAVDIKKGIRDQTREKVQAARERQAKAGLRALMTPPDDAEAKRLAKLRAQLSRRPAQAEAPRSPNFLEMNNG